MVAAGRDHLERESPGLDVVCDRSRHRDPDDGRLVVPANHAEARTGIHRSHLIVSDDGGKSWTLGGSSDAGTNESQVVELPTGGCCC